LEPGTTSVFFLLPELGACPESAAAGALALGLPRDRFRVTVGVLGPTPGPAAEALRAAGVAVHSVPVRHAFDLGGVRRLRDALWQSAAAVVHAFGPNAARTARLLLGVRRDGGNSPQLVVSGAASPGGGLGGWLTRRQLRRADRVVASTWAEGERYRRLGVHGDRLTRVSPAAPEPAPFTEVEGVLRRLGVPPGSRLLVSGGRADRRTGPKDAVVAFDMLRYDFRDLYLLVFGVGADAPTLEQFGRALAFDDLRIRLSRAPADRAAAVRVASVVWVTAPRDGVDEALEAMAAGRPVVAWATPELTEIVDDGVTGFLVPPGDRAALAAKTRLLLGDAAAAARMGEAGRARADERFPASRALEQLGRLYAEVAG
jgi:glycosyltransferase involved in cell wall biosynthesis